MFIIKAHCRVVFALRVNSAAATATAYEDLGDAIITTIVVTTRMNLLACRMIVAPISGSADQDIAFPQVNTVMAFESKYSSLSKI
jgi:hypothetical protein